MKTLYSATGYPKRGHPGMWLWLTVVTDYAIYCTSIDCNFWCSQLLLSGFNQKLGGSLNTFSDHSGVQYLDRERKMVAYYSVFLNIITSKNH